MNGDERYFWDGFLSTLVSRGVSEVVTVRGKHGRSLSLALDGAGEMFDALDEGDRFQYGRPHSSDFVSLDFPAFDTALITGFQTGQTRSIYHAGRNIIGVSLEIPEDSAGRTLEGYSPEQREILDRMASVFVEDQARQAAA